MGNLCMSKRNFTLAGGKFEDDKNAKKSCVKNVLVCAQVGRLK